MIETMIVAATLAAASPSVAYRADPRGATDVGTVALQPLKHNCFEVVRAAILASSRKTDRTRAYVLSLTIGDGNAPFQLQRVDRADGQPMRTINLRHGDVACTEYQCPTGSAGVFELTEADRSAIAAGALTVIAKTNVGDRCDVNVTIRKAEIEALDAWLGRLPAPRG